MNLRYLRVSSIPQGWHWPCEYKTAWLISMEVPPHVAANFVGEQFSAVARSRWASGNEDSIKGVASRTSIHSSISFKQRIMKQQKLRRAVTILGVIISTAMLGSLVHRQESERPIKAFISNLVKTVDTVSIGLRSFFQSSWTAATA
jgi:hypothetical protein